MSHLWTGTVTETFWPRAPMMVTPGKINHRNSNPSRISENPKRPVFNFNLISSELNFRIWSTTGKLEKTLGQHKVNSLFLHIYRMLSTRLWNVLLKFPICKYYSWILLSGANICPEVEQDGKFHSERRSRQVCLNSTLWRTFHIQGVFFKLVLP